MSVRWSRWVCRGGKPWILWMRRLLPSCRRKRNRFSKTRLICSSEATLLMPRTWTSSSLAVSARKALVHRTLWLHLSSQINSSNNNRRTSKCKGSKVPLTMWQPTLSTNLSHLTIQLPLKVKRPWCSIERLFQVRHPMQRILRPSSPQSLSWTSAASSPNSSTSLTCRMVPRRSKNVKASLRSKKRATHRLSTRTNAKITLGQRRVTCRHWNRSARRCTTIIRLILTQLSPRRLCALQRRPEKKSKRCVTNCLKCVTSARSSDSWANVNAF